MEAVKKLLIDAILGYYETSWQSYDHSMLLEQIKEIENPPVVNKSMPKETLIKFLLEEDKRVLSQQTVKELQAELNFQKKY